MHLTLNSMSVSPFGTFLNHFQGLSHFFPINLCPWFALSKLTMKWVVVLRGLLSAEHLVNMY